MALGAAPTTTTSLTPMAAAERSSSPKFFFLETLCSTSSDIGARAASGCVEAAAAGAAVEGLPAICMCMCSAAGFGLEGGAAMPRRR